MKISLKIVYKAVFVWYNQIMSEPQKKKFYLHKISNLLNVQKIATIHYQVLGKNYTFPEEIHDFWEINYADKENLYVVMDGKRIELKVAAYDEKGLIGEGTHERFIIANERFLAKTQRKLEG